MHLVQANFAYNAGVADPAELLESYRTLTGWSEALLQAGAARVSVVQRFSRSARVVWNGVTYHFCSDGQAPVPRVTSALAGARAAVAALAPDIVHVNGFVWPVATALLRRSLDDRAGVLLQHHADEPPGSRAGRLLRRTGMSAADALLFAALGLAKPWQEAGLIHPGTHVYEVMTAGSLIRPVPDAARLPGTPSLLWVGGLTRNKDPLAVIDGFRLALDSLPEAHLTMVFRGEDLLGAIRARVAADSVLVRRVHLAGARPHGAMAAMFSGADIFVAGSHREGSGNALTEALACGTVPVVTDIPSFRVLTDEGRVGALWPVGDVQALAAALAAIGRGDRRRASAEAKELFNRRFSWPAVGERALSIYREVVERRQSGALR